jgi:peptidoglycan/xylan/chitin deacetylase (PgdA/CDA1 family)
MDLRSWLLTARYYASLPWRHCANWFASRQGIAPVMVLFYHRVADTHPNDWTMPRAVFAQQLEWLQRHVELISLAEARQRLASGRNARLAASITFDDGYADNCDFALPLLLSAGVPCTYFVASRHVLEQCPFPHDVQRRQPLAVNTPDQILAMAREGIEIGAHTRTHADLGRLDKAAQLYDEIAGSGEDLADLTGKPVRFFSFPYGQPAHISAQALRVVEEAGYLAACSAYGGYNIPGRNPFHIQRIHGDVDMLRFRNWLTVDSRKSKLHPPLAFSTAETAAHLQEA